MLDIKALDESLKLKALGRLVNTTHPFLRLIKERVNLKQFFYPSVDANIDEVSTYGLKLLEKDRDDLWDDIKFDRHRELLQVVADTEIDLLVGERGRVSMPFFLLRARGLRKVSQLTVQELHSLNRFIDKKKLRLLNLAIRMRIGNAPPAFLESYFINGRSKHLGSVTSKEIRENRTKRQPIGDFKIGTLLSDSELKSWGMKLAKVTSTKHKNVLLRVAHGEIYTKEKLHRFGLIDSPLCPRCQSLETLQHKFLECPYVERIWNSAFSYMRALTTDNLNVIERSKLIIGGHLNSTITMLTINAEIINRILTFKDDQNFLLRPNLVVKQAVTFLRKRERSVKIKNDLDFIHEAIGG